jgi:hypothetical protein
MSLTKTEDDLTFEQWCAWRVDLIERGQRKLAIHHTTNRHVDLSDLQQEADDLLNVRDAMQWLGKWPTEKKEKEEI